jgi:hypothetical protein
LVNKQAAWPTNPRAGKRAHAAGSFSLRSTACCHKHDDGVDGCRDRRQACATACSSPRSTAGWVRAGGVSERARRQVQWQRGQVREPSTSARWPAPCRVSALRQAQRRRGWARGPSASATAAWSSGQVRRARQRACAATCFGPPWRRGRAQHGVEQ